MNKGKLLTRAVFSFQTVLIGLLMLADILGKTETFISNWYIVLLVGVAVQFFTIAVTRKAPTYAVFVVLSIALSILIKLIIEENGLNFFNLWPIMPLALGIGIFIKSCFTKYSAFGMKFGVMLTVVSGGALAAGLLRGWEIFGVVALISLGLLVAFTTIINYKKQQKLLKNKDNGDYYVQPTVKNDE